MSNTKEIRLTATIRISKKFTKEDFLLNFVGHSHLASQHNKLDMYERLYMTEEMAEKVWTALTKKTDGDGEIDLGHDPDAETANDLEYDFIHLIGEEKEKLETQKPKKTIRVKAKSNEVQTRG